MRFSSLFSLLIVLLLIHSVFFSEADVINETALDSASGKSTDLEKGKWNKEKVEQEQGNFEGAEETVMENGDYIYTQSLP